MSDRAARIRALNDRMRTTLTGRIMLTNGVLNLPDGALAQVISKVRAFDQFSNDNDPYGEHDFGAVELDGDTYFFKFDYYDRAMQCGSEDPADEAKTTRVMTIMCASEY